ncbi:Arc family DNA-binding protein [Pseudomonas antarctica]|uniref:Arc family DNA-binding protein n=1 Tax=Pseudomonas antarctica TaxID=219572 RepID=UPI0039C2435A
MAEAVDRFVLRLPENLRQTLKRIAKENLANKARLVLIREFLVKTIRVSGRR